jgi:hypothetical protein
MPILFDAFPGQEVAVSGIDSGFNKMWADSPAKDNRAVQLNLVVYFGSSTQVEEALRQFAAMVAFARGFPCRVVILCPLHGETGDQPFRAKIHGECFLGKSTDDTRAVEFVMLSYPPRQHAFLEDQVSICLSSDMPVYFWAHRFTSTRTLAAYHYLLTRSRRIVFDSAIVPAEAFTYAWPNQSAVRDLAYTRTRLLRQTIGQFLSRYAPPLIVDGLTKVTLSHRAEHAPEARCMIGWVTKGLARCGGDTKKGIAFESTPSPSSSGFEFVFHYSDPKKSFRWTADLPKSVSNFEGDLGTGRTSLVVGAKLLDSNDSLSEALFA